MARILIVYSSTDGHTLRICERLRQVLEPSGAEVRAFFSISIVARKPEKNRPETNPYLGRFLARIRWRPRLVAVFAGRLDYPRYRPLDRLAIRLIMLMTGGPTDPRAVVEFTDWGEVEAFGRRVAAL